MKKSLVLLLVVVLVCTVGGCGSKDKPPKTEAPAAPLPAGPAEKTDLATPSANSNRIETGQFTIVVKNALLFDGDTDPFTRNISQEKGICLLVTGTVRNETNRIFHRGGIFATLNADFSGTVNIKKHSGGMGFLPEVTSEQPWRPGAWREFRLVTRAIDPIYKEYTPTNVETELVLEVRDPLKYRQRKMLTRFKLSWQTLLGAGVSGTTALVEQITPFTLENFAARRFESGDLLKLTFQKGAGFKVLNDDGAGGWVPYWAISMDTQDFEVLAPKKIPFQDKSADLVVTLDRFTVTPSPETGMFTYVADLQVINNDPKQTVNIRAMDLLVEFGPETAETGTLRVRQNGELKKVSSFTLKPTESMVCDYTVTQSSQTPLELVWWITSKRRVALPLVRH